MATSLVYKSLVQAPPPAPVANGGTAAGSSVVLDLEALEKVFKPQQLEAVTRFLNVLDKNEEEASVKRVCLFKKELLRKKNIAADRNRWRQFLRLKSAFDEESAKDEIDEEYGDGGRLPEIYSEIKRLLVIQQSPIHAKALEEWSKKETLFSTRVERKKQGVANVKSDVYQLLGIFSVFQGVLLTAVAQSSLLHCNNWWSPIALSLMASVVTISGVVQKLKRILEFQHTIHSEEQSLKELASRLNTRNRGVDGFEFAEFENREPKELSLVHFRIYFSLVISSLIVFLAGFLFRTGEFCVIQATLIGEFNFTSHYLNRRVVKVTIFNLKGGSVPVKEGNARCSM